MSTRRPSTPTSSSSTTDDAAAFVARCRDEGVLVGAVGAREIRLVTHLDISRADAESAAAVLSKIR